MDIWSSLYCSSIHYFNFSSIRYFCGYSLISRNFKMVDSINFKLVAFICFFWHMQTIFSSVVRISGLCLSPMEVWNIIFSAFYLSFTKELFPLHLGHHYCQAGYDSEDVIWKKSTEKKGFPSLINKSPPFLLLVMIYKYLRCKHEIYN